MSDVTGSAKEQAIAFALRQGDRCRNYGPERTENENAIVTLADEVERLQQELARRQPLIGDEQAEAWEAVWEKLWRINPALAHAPKSGLQCALDEIDRLAGRSDEPTTPRLFTLNGLQVRALWDFMDLGGSDPDFTNETEVSIAWFDERPPVDGEPSPAGYYAWFSDYPEEGSLYLVDQPAETKEGIESLSGGNPGEKSVSRPADHRGIVAARSSEGGIVWQNPGEPIQFCEPVDSDPVSGGAGEPGALDTRKVLTPHSPLTAQPPLPQPVCTDGLQIISKHGQPYGIRDRNGYLLFLTQVQKFDGQEDRYRSELAQRFKLADFLLQSLKGAAPVQSQMPAELRAKLGPVIETDEWDDSQDLMDRDRG